MGNSKILNFVVWLVAVLLSSLFIYFGHNMVSQDLEVFQSDVPFEKAKITAMNDALVTSYESENDPTYQEVIILFECEILRGENKGQKVQAYQTMDADYGQIKAAEVGDKIIICNYPTDQTEAEWALVDYARFDTIVALTIIFFLLIVLLGRVKGLNTIISLAFTCMVVFLIFIPAVLNGYNIYACTIVTCVYTIIMTLVIIGGVSRKTIVTILGCAFGVVTAAILSVVMDKILFLSGLLDEHSIYLTMLSQNNPIDLKAMIFASIVIGAMGAVMDVAMDISSSLYEIRQHAEYLSIRSLVKSGISIGRDIMGTMANTLVLAYIGSSLCSVLIYIHYAISIEELLNKEVIIVDFLQAIIGSMAILLTIPLTAVAAGLMYPRKKKVKTHEEVNSKEFLREAFHIEDGQRGTAQQAHPEQGMYPGQEIYPEEMQPQQDYYFEPEAQGYEQQGHEQQTSPQEQSYYFDGDTQLPEDYAATGEWDDNNQEPRE